MKPTINNIQHQTLFSLQELLDLAPDSKFDAIFSVIDLRPAINFLSNHGRGANGYNKGNIVKALIARQVEQIPSITALRERLNTDFYFAHACGFKFFEAIPSVDTLCRYHNKLADNDILDYIIHDLLMKAYHYDLIDPDKIALDSSKLESYDSPKSNAQIDKNDPNRADWGAKYDSHKNLIKWFGYKLHLACDTEGEIPIAFSLKPANEADSSNALELIEKTDTVLPENTSYFIMDKGYDTEKIYKTIATEYEAQAIIPLNLRNRKKPDLCFHDFKGTPQCSGGFKMIYWGHDNGFNKFRCPHAAGKINCPHGTKWCSDSDYGLVVKTKPSDDYRKFSLPHRDSQTWEKIYNQRTAVERVFSRLKENFNLTNITMTGRKKAAAHMKLSVLSYLASKVAVAKSQQKQVIQAA